MKQSMTIPTRLLLLASFFFSIAAWAHDDASHGIHFKHSVPTAKKPWTNKPFLNNPNNFQFALVSDRTGGVRAGVFPKAVKRLNELRPEFVISVGDLIKGGAKLKNERVLREQWKEFNSFIEGFDMPFFYLPGNHDVGNEVADQIWDDLYGVRFYSFTYKDVLFLCLNTQDGPGSKPPLLGDKQIQWAIGELKKHHKVRWTLIFIHQPLWLMEEGIEIRREGKKILRRSNTGWPKIEKALGDRKYTVFAGHVHHYGKYMRNQRAYYTLGTTGGGSRLRGTALGEFDHVTWVTMTDQGPRMANLLVDGILPDDIATESHQVFWRSLLFEEYFEKGTSLNEKTLTLPLHNSFEFEIKGKLSWKLAPNSNWAIKPEASEVVLQPEQEKTFRFTILRTKPDKKLSKAPLPKLGLRFNDEGKKLDLDMLLEIPLER